MSFRRTRPKRFSLFFLGVDDEFFSSFSFLKCQTQQNRDAFFLDSSPLFLVGCRKKHKSEEEENKILLFCEKRQILLPFKKGTHTQERILPNKKTKKRMRKKQKTNTKKTHKNLSIFSLSFLRSVAFTSTRTRLLLIVIEEREREREREREYILQSI